MAESEIKKITLLENAQPLFVSIVTAGANRRKFKVIKFLKDDVDEGDELELTTKGPVGYKKYPLSRSSWPRTSGGKPVGIERVQQWAGGPDKEKINWTKYAQAFGWFDSANSKTFGAYKLPHHTIVNGQMVTVRQAVQAAMNIVLGGFGGINMPSGDKRSVYNHLAKHYREFGDEVPEFKLKSDESGDVILEGGIEEELLNSVIDSLEDNTNGFDRETPPLNDSHKKEEQIVDKDTRAVNQETQDLQASAVEEVTPTVETRVIEESSDKENLTWIQKQREKIMDWVFPASIDGVVSKGDKTEKGFTSFSDAMSVQSVLKEESFWDSFMQLRNVVSEIVVSSDIPKADKSKRIKSAITEFSGFLTSILDESGISSKMEEAAQNLSNKRKYDDGPKNHGAVSKELEEKLRSTLDSVKTVLAEVSGEGIADAKEEFDMKALEDIQKSVEGLAKTVGELGTRLGNHEASLKKDEELDEEQKIQAAADKEAANNKIKEDVKEVAKETAEETVEDKVKEETEKAVIEAIKPISEAVQTITKTVEEMGKRLDNVEASPAGSIEDADPEVVAKSRVIEGTFNNLIDFSGAPVLQHGMTQKTSGRATRPGR